MAFVIVSSTTTVRPLSQTAVQKVYEITVRTIPEGIDFVYDFPYEAWIAAGGAEALDAVVAPVAADVQAIAADANVAEVYYAQDTNAAGLLTGFIEAVVQVKSRDPNGGYLQATAEIPIEILGNPEFRQFTWAAILDKTLAQLQATAGIS